MILALLARSLPVVTQILGLTYRALLPLPHHAVLAFNFYLEKNSAFSSLVGLPSNFWGPLYSEKANNTLISKYIHAHRVSF